MLNLKRLTIKDKEIITEVFISVFTKEPWNDDWSNTNQLDMYINDLVGQGYSLTYGLFDDNKLICIGPVIVPRLFCKDADKYLSNYFLIFYSKSF